MPETKSSTDADRARKREWAARKKAELSGLTKLEQLAYKHRAKLPDGYDPYTPAERERVQAIRGAIEALERQAEALHQDLVARLGKSGDTHDRLLGAALLGDSALRVDLKPF